MAATDLERLVVQLSADITKYERSLQKALNQTQKSTKKVESLFDSMNKRISLASSSMLSQVTSVGAGIGAALGVREIIQYADEWTIAGNKIKAASTAMGVNVRSLNQLKDGANEARTDLSSYADLYAKLIRSAAPVAKNEEEIARATEIVSKSFKAGGAAAQEQAAGILQLGQALGSGVLQGDELRSLRENAPVLAKAIANEFKVTVAGLKQLGAEGKLTSDRVFKAILNAQKDVESQFKATNSTIADAMTQVNNEFLAYIGNADASAGASRALIDALQFVAKNFSTIATVVADFATVIIAALTGRAIAGLIVGLGNAVVALGGFLTALRAGTLVAGSFVAALGPIGLLAGGAAAAIYLLSSNLNSTQSATATANTALEANRKALDAAKAGSEDYSAALRNQISMQYEAAKASFDLAYAESLAARARADNFREMTKAMTGVEMSFAPLDYQAHSLDDQATEIGKAALKLKAQLGEIDEARKKLGSGYGGGYAASTDSKAGKQAEKDAKAFQRQIDQIKERTELIKAETEAQSKLNPLIDDYGYAVAKARAEQDLLNEAKKNNIKLTPEMRQGITDVAEAYAQATVAANKLDEQQQRIKDNAQQMTDLQKDVTRGLVDDLLAGTSAADAFANALSKIGSKLLDMAFDSFFDSKSSGGLGGFGGFFSSLFKGFANGGYTGPGGKNDPAGVVHRGEYVIPKATVDKVGVDQIERLFGGYADGGLVGGNVSAPSMPARVPGASSSGDTFNYSPQYDNRGVDSDRLNRLEQLQAKDRAEFASKAVASVQKAKKQNVKGL